ncbi:hypothetical protein R3P38DRAFT_3059094 [Favolaschia claudopus]|uniref:F-box domain-containing protein n=1 Tax=Favolaschia claudopus TaxID=2862362 RepID=A0AAW0A272_9AGAR
MSATVTPPTELVSHISGLPVELLVEIFELTICEKTHISDVFRISHVCSVWRQVAHGTPQLWNQPLRVAVQSTGNPGPLYLEGLKTWLAHSEPFSIPLVFELRQGTRGAQDWGPSACKEWNPNSPVWDMILEIAPRLRSLQSPAYKHHLPLSLPLFERLAHSKTFLDSLETLNVCAAETDLVLPPSILPRLRKLSIVYVHYCPQGPQLQASWPWAQLNNLKLSVPGGFGVILEILSECPNLTCAWVQACTSWPNFSNIRKHITLRHLRFLTFKVHEYSSGHVVPFFDHLFVPALEYLLMDFDTPMIYLWSETQFSAFQLRTSTITHLDFRYLRPLSPQHFMAILQHAQNLTHLKISHLSKAFDRSIINALIHTYGVPSIVPRLHHLTLHGNSGVPCHFGTKLWANMLMSRWWTDEQVASNTLSPAVARWTHVDLKCSERHKPAIEALQCAGLPVHCRYY